MLDNILPVIFAVIAVGGCVCWMFKRPNSEKGEKKSKLSGKGGNKSQPSDSSGTNEQ